MGVAHMGMVGGGVVPVGIVVGVWHMWVWWVGV